MLAHLARSGPRAFPRACSPPRRALPEHAVLRGVHYQSTSACITRACITRACGPLAFLTSSFGCCPRCLACLLYTSDAADDM
eukprot:5379455-Prorocentrum_lima.AAC.1